MKKIGILFGQENTFPQAFIDRVNEKNVDGITAEAVSIEMVQQAKPTEYAVIIDRISQDVPFYRSYLKNAAICGTAVINNPFWWSADEKFVNNALAEKVGVAVPKTVILPSNHRPDDTDENSFRNLKIMDWDNIFKYIGFPAYMKPHAGGGWKSVYRVENPDDLFTKHQETEQLVMMLQEEIQFTEYFRCYYLGGDRVHIMQYEPRNPHHLRYLQDAPPVDKAIMDKVHEGVIKLNHALGYDFNTVEFAVRDGVPYAIDFCNPAPDADIHSVGEENFEWIVENAANLAIERAQAQKPGKMNLTWGNFVKDQTAAEKPGAKTKAPAAKKSAPAKKTAAKKAAPAKKATPAKKAAPAKSSAAKKPAQPQKAAAPKSAAKADSTAKRMMAAPAKPKAAPKKQAAKPAANKATKPVAKKAATPAAKKATKTASAKGAAKK
ncbi:MAG TPA: hypothetical protein VJ911_00275 [Cryomorphaceae bacterium]|nr:hypothetical protein [Cryomorphaceae bacterium]